MTEFHTNVYVKQSPLDSFITEIPWLLLMFYYWYVLVLLGTPRAGFFEFVFTCIFIPVVVFNIRAMRFSIKVNKWIMANHERRGAAQVHVATGVIRPGGTLKISFTVSEEDK